MPIAVILTGPSSVPSGCSKAHLKWVLELFQEPKMFYYRFGRIEFPTNCQDGVVPNSTQTTSSLIIALTIAFIDL